uniref:Uncharacterized protein n=1 Tax=Physcomitrium patens TaxID=3218 RepID=A0A2K1KII2_PHYPA|nr:hypothetical protein PHYPA_007269 [Physcomitrium patens]
MTYSERTQPCKLGPSAGKTRAYNTQAHKSHGSSYRKSAAVVGSTLIEIVMNQHNDSRSCASSSKCHH